MNWDTGFCEACTNPCLFWWAIGLTQGLLVAPAYKATAVLMGALTKGDGDGA